MKLPRVLLVEDNAGDAFLVRRALEQHGVGHELHVAEDGELALEYISRMGTPDGPPCPDILLLDLNLPKADGSKVLAEFRRHPESGATPVVVITSSDAPSDRARVAKLGVSRYFRKPTDLDEFMELGGIVRTLLHSGRAGKQ